MSNPQQIKELLAELTYSVNKLDYHGLHEYALHLEKLVKDLEGDLLEHGMLGGEN